MNVELTDVTLVTDLDVRARIQVCSCLRRVDNVQERARQQRRHLERTIRQCMKQYPDPPGPRHELDVNQHCANPRAISYALRHSTLAEPPQRRTHFRERLHANMLEGIFRVLRDSDHRARDRV